MTNVWGKASRDRRLWTNLYILEALSHRRIHSSSTPSAFGTLVPIKAKIVRITSHLRCPSFSPLRINLITRTERALDHTPSMSVSYPSVPLPGGYFRGRDDHPVRLLNLSLPAEILSKWLTVVALGVEVPPLSLVTDVTIVSISVWVTVYNFIYLFIFLVWGKVLRGIYPEIKFIFAKLRDQKTANRCTTYPGTQTCPVVIPYRVCTSFPVWICLFVCTMHRHVYIYLFANSCNFPPCHTSPFQVPQYNPGWDSLCLADKFRAWQFKLLTPTIQSLSLKNVYVLPMYL